MEFKIKFNVLPPSANEYIKPRVNFVNGRAFPGVYESSKSKEFKKYFREALMREAKKQNWDKSITEDGHWYLECSFTQMRTNQDCNNYFKILLDSLTGYIIMDDKNILPRVHQVKYDPKNPSFSLVLRKVQYVGLFKNEQQKNDFESKCESCRFYRDGGCSILNKIKASRVTQEYNESENTCKKYTERKGKK